ncbi:hypothetical protein Gotur_025133 [Gossypium turneri]
MRPLPQKGRCHPIVVKGPYQLVREEGLKTPSSKL